jgi:hypothetical protein
MIAQTCGKDLRFAFHAAKSASVNNTVAVPQKIVSIRVSWFWESPAVQLARFQPEPAEHRCRWLLGQL